MLNASIGTCKQPVSIPNAIMMGGGNLAGDMIRYECYGEYMWSDLSQQPKSIECQEYGLWIGILATCKSMQYLNIFSTLLYKYMNVCILKLILIINMCMLHYFCISCPYE